MALPNIWEVKPNELNANMNSKFFFFYGEQGTWKTTVASQFPKPLLAGFEIGYQFIDGIHAIPMTSWSDMKDLYRQLRMKQAKDKYETIVFDTISAAYDMCYEYVLNTFGVKDLSEVPWGKGWQELKNEFSIIKKISKLGYGLVFIAHGKETEVVDPTTKETQVRVKIDLGNAGATMVAALVDFVFYVRKELDNDGVERVYAYSDAPGIETKKRLYEFEPRILFTYKNIERALNEAVAKRKEAGGLVTDENINIRAVEIEPWEKIRDEVIELITEMNEGPAHDDMYRFITELFPNTRISETTELHRGKLVAARDQLRIFKEKV